MQLKLPLQRRELLLVKLSLSQNLRERKPVAVVVAVGSDGGIRSISGGDGVSDITKRTIVTQDVTQQVSAK